MKGQMNWDQTALDAWLKESAKRDEDTLILQKYTRVDDSKIKVVVDLMIKETHIKNLFCQWYKNKTNCFN